MYASITANAWWTSFSNWAMVVPTVDSFTVRFLFTIIVMRVRALVLLVVVLRPSVF